MIVVVVSCGGSVVILSENDVDGEVLTTVWYCVAMGTGVHIVVMLNVPEAHHTALVAKVEGKMPRC